MRPGIRAALWVVGSSAVVLAALAACSTFSGGDTATNPDASDGAPVDGGGTDVGNEPDGGRDAADASTDALVCPDTAIVCDDFERANADIFGTMWDAAAPGATPQEISIATEDGGNRFLETRAGSLTSVYLQRETNLQGHKFTLDLDMAYADLPNGVVITFALEFDRAGPDAGAAETATVLFVFNNVPGAGPGIALQTDKQSDGNNVASLSSPLANMPWTHVTLTVEIDAANNATATVARMDGFSFGTTVVSSTTTAGQFKPLLRRFLLGETFVDKPDGGGLATFGFDNVVLRPN